MADVDYATRYGLIATRGPEQRAGRPRRLRRRLGDGPRRSRLRDRRRAAGTRARHDPARPPRRGRRRTTGSRPSSPRCCRENHRMIEMFRESGFPVETSSAPRASAVELPTSFSADAVARFEDRDRLAAASAVRRLPRAALDRRRRRLAATAGRSAARSSTTCSTPASPGRSTRSTRPRTASSRCRPTPASATIPGEVDLAVIAVPAEAVAEVARECAGQGGARRWSCSRPASPRPGADGAERERELLAVCREAGMRLIGPNCLGILNTDPELGLNATFAPPTPPRRQRRLRHPERRPRPRPDRLRRGPRARRLLLRLGRQSRRRHRQRPARVLGGGRAAPRSPSSTSSPSAIRGASRGWRGGSGGSKPIVVVKSGRSRAGRARRQLPHRRAPRRLRPRPSTRSSSSRG